jgi:hypothetical protein
MYWKRILSAGFAVCVLTSSVMAAPTITVTPGTTANASGNRVWTVRVIPDAAPDLPSSLAVELAFTMTPGSSAQPMSIVDNAAIDTNSSNPGALNDTWYFNETTAGSGTILWNTTDPPNVADLAQNVGENPFMGGASTEGLFTSGTNLFAALGSTVISAGTTSVNTLQIVTQGRGGILTMGAGVVAQNEVQFAVAPQSFYVPGDFDGDGIVGTSDFNLLSFNFGDPAPPAWDGFQPVGALVGTGDFNNLSFNFGAGQSSGSGAVVGDSNNVPEPSSAILLLLAGSLAAWTRRRR